MQQDPDLLPDRSMSEAEGKFIKNAVDFSLLRCSQKTSIYSHAVWFPVFGPLWDLTTNTQPGVNAFWYLASTAVPIIGPAMQLSLGSKRCLTQCLPTPDQIRLTDDAVNSTNPVNVESVADRQSYFDLALSVSDANCQRFLNDLAIDEDVAEEAPKKLTQELIATIKANRQAARSLLLCSPLNDQEVLAKINNYDNLCNIDFALATLLNAVENQNSGNSIGNKQDQIAWLQQHGITRLPVTSSAAALPMQNKNCLGPAAKSKANGPHINNFYNKK